MQKYLITTASVLALLATPVFADTPDRPVDQDYESHDPLEIEIPQLEHDLNANIVPTSDLEAPGEGLTNQTSTISQSGWQNEAFTNQAYGNEGISSIQQIGDANQATVIQAENGDRSSAGFGTPANQSTIIQGVGGDGGASHENVASVTQIADPDAAGPTNVSLITQDSDDAVGASVTATLYQEGLGNDSNISQTGADNETTVSQFGWNNDSLVNQGGWNNNTIVGQSGENNVSDVWQRGEYNSAALWQEGNDNGAWVEQGGSYNSLDSTQTGDGNNATLRQRGFNNETGDALGIDNNQEGNGNTTTITQNSIESSIVNAQLGDYQSSTLTQRGGVNNSIVNEQIGSGNDTQILQFRGDNNVAGTFQNGSDNTLQAVQGGWSNEIASIQVGSGNSILIGDINDDGPDNFGQNGTDQLIDVLQYGVDNTFNVEYQLGDGNEIYGKQETAFNLATVSQDGWNNVADIGQGLAGAYANVATVTQWGSGNAATVQQ